MNRSIILLLICWLVVTSFTAPYINPTGTCHASSKVYGKNKSETGPSGTVKVKAVDKNKVVIDLEVNNGWPSFNSGGIADTLAYHGNSCVYIDKDLPGCVIKFTFSSRNVAVVQKGSDGDCGFGNNVYADGHYPKMSFKVPVIDMYSE